MEPIDLTTKTTLGNGLATYSALQSEVAYRKRLQEIGNKMFAASNVDAILVDLKEEIAQLFNAERITIYVVDGQRRELVSRYKSGYEIAEIRIPLASSSLAGYAASKQQLLNIKNAYDPRELTEIDSELAFDRSWDAKTGFITRQVLVCPIIYERRLLGVIQLINHKQNLVFSADDEQSVQELAGMLAVAFFNQSRLRKRPAKFDYLVQNNLISEQDLHNAFTVARQHDKALEAVLMEQFRIPRDAVITALSHFYQVPFTSFDVTIPVPKTLLKGLNPAFMRKHLWVPLGLEDEKIVIAIDNPHDRNRIDTIRSLFKNRPLKLHGALEQDIIHFIKYFSGEKVSRTNIDSILDQLQKETPDSAPEVPLAEEASEQDNSIIQLVNQIIREAHAREASDIHIEPQTGREDTLVRLRVDGKCFVYRQIPYHFRKAVVSRIKIMASLDIAERRKPQDGKIRLKQADGRLVELRVATVPTQGDLEDVVLRILQAGDPIPLDRMNFSRRNYDNFTTAINQPYGIIFVCGPTGSGKTTTLHSALGFINQPERKIWTAEDPVEITQKGLRQVQVKPKIGFTFAAAMRAFLRADPDVIMVGEMRDRETAHIGIEASLTGHLVFSTLHTNSAPESVSRLLDMGMDPFNFADAILCILAQRLLPTLCKGCKEAYQPSQNEFDTLVHEYGEADFEKNVDQAWSSDLQLFRPKGCGRCHQTGYRGRIAIHELLMGTDTIRQLIRNKASIEALRQQAYQDGMTTLRQDGIEKVLAGHCDLKQVRKVTMR